jgi:hypothetical protein
MNWQSGGRYGNRGRHGIGQERSPNTRVWSGRRQAARSRMTARRNGRGSISGRVAQLLEAQRLRFQRRERWCLLIAGLRCRIRPQPGSIIMSLFAKIFTTKTLLQIVFVLAATVMMKAMSVHYDFSWATALAQG